METKFMILIALSLNIYTIHSLKTIDVEYSLKSSTPEPLCTTSGVSCLNCWTSLNCIDLGNETFYPDLQYCAVGRTCKYETGFCEPIGNYECSEIDKLQCNNVEGIFPSPYNNMEYFTCVRGSANTLLKYVSKCNPSYIFDPAQKLCRKKMKSDDSYSSLVPVCKFENETGPIKSNPNIFYRCEKETVDIGFNFIPQIYGCDFNLKFNGTDCIDYKSDFVEVMEEKCFNDDNFPYPTDCRKYYICQNGQSPIIESCSNNHRYDDSYKGCRYVGYDYC